MPDVELTFAGYQCSRCGHEWVPLRWMQRPIVCPKCKSPYWDQERRPAKPSPREQSKPGEVSDDQEVIQERSASAAD